MTIGHKYFFNKKNTFCHKFYLMVKGDLHHEFVFHGLNLFTTFFYGKKMIFLINLFCDEKYYATNIL